MAAQIKNKRLAQIGELGFIRRLQRSFPAIGDDTAVLPLAEGKNALFTTDMLIEGVHFKANDEPGLIGRKALNVNISDIAAMGGLPKYAVISLGAPGTLPVAYIDNLYKGLKKAAWKFNVAIVGGDSVRSSKLIINVALWGEAAQSHVVTRAGARDRDFIFVTGVLGRSLQTGRHLSFTPRIKESQYLIRHCKPNAMIDLSDGLANDLDHICAASGLGAALYKEEIPRYKNEKINHALYDGEDFELLFTCSGIKAAKLRGKRLKGIRFYCIGRMDKRLKGVHLIDKNGKKKKVEPKGYAHF